MLMIVPMKMMMMIIVVVTVLFATSPIATPMNVDDKDDDLDQERYLLKKEMHL
jgi:hypothetical protein